MVETVTNLAEKQTSLEEVYLVDINMDIVNIIYNALAQKEEFSEQDFSGCPWLQKTSKNVSGFFKSPPADLDPEELCIICMDKMDSPVALKKCQHVFCCECITASFKHKPVCPVCGMIYGAVMGNQPEDGTMEDYVEDQLSLEGYEGYGTIIINYSFYDGIQGVRT